MTVVWATVAVPRGFGPALLLCVGWRDGDGFFHILIGRECESVQLSYMY